MMRSKNEKGRDSSRRTRKRSSHARYRSEQQDRLLRIGREGVASTALALRGIWSLAWLDLLLWRRMPLAIVSALPSAIVAFGRQFHLSGIRVQVAEHDLINHDTGFIPYLIVSGLVLDAFVIAGILSAMAVAREFESGTVKLLAIAPVHPLLSLLGRVLATNAVAISAMLFPVLLVTIGYRVLPIHPLEMVGVLLLCIFIFGCIGVALGAVLRRTLPVASLIFGLCLPLYLCSNAWSRRDSMAT